MGVVRMSEGLWDRARTHLLAHPERFAFFFARVTYSCGRPVFLATELYAVPDERVSFGRGGYEVDLDVVLDVINRAVKSGEALIEGHSHGGRSPRFSSTTDRPGLEEISQYILSSLPGRPYAATVWGDETVYGEYFLQDSGHGVLRSVLVIGTRLRQLVSRDDDVMPLPSTFNRQLPWFTEQGQRALARLRFGLVGAGGTGSQSAQQLTYLGGRDVAIVEFDRADITNGNRLVTATPADLGTPKGMLARRLIRSVAPDAHVDLIEGQLQSEQALDALRGVDVILGCVDNDGARLVLNELARAYAIPYIDVAVGIETDEHGAVVEAGGRVVLVLPDGPCLNCVGEIDGDEARFYLSSPKQRSVARARGYVRDVRAPAVVSLNAIGVSVAMNELALWLSGIRTPNLFTDIDLLGTGRRPGQWLTPRVVSRLNGCVECMLEWLADAAGIGRHVRNGEQ